VLKGFIIGLALTIMVGQLPKLFGFEKTSGDFFEQLWGFITHLDDTSLITLAVGAVSLVVVLVLRRFVPAVPGSLVAVILGIAAVKIFDLSTHGVAIVGHIDSGLPSIGFPDSVGASDYGRLVASAVGVMLVGFAEGLGAAKTYAARDHYEIDANRELIGLGAANIGAGVCGAMVVNGSLSKTAVNGSAGARTQLSGLVVAVLTVVTLLFLTGLFEDLPEATLAAVVIAALIELVDVPAMVKLYRVFSGRLGRIYGIAARADFIAAAAAMLGVLVFDTLPGLFIGITMSLLLLLYRSSQPHVAVLGAAADGESWIDASRHPDAVTRSDIVVVRPESGLYFANADNVRREVTAKASPPVLAIVLDAQSVPAIDVTAADMLTALNQELERRGVRFLIARDVGQVRDVLDHSDAADLGPILRRTVRDAIAELDGPETMHI
jgi:MFS superfamily sulfate permease-like transporter